MNRFLFSVVLMIISSFTLRANSDVPTDFKNFGDDLKFVLDDIEKLVINQKKKETTTLYSVQRKLSFLDMDQNVILLFSKQTFEECDGQNQNYTTNFDNILNKLENIDNIKTDVKTIEVEDKMQRDELQNVQNAIKSIFLKISDTETSLTNTMQTHADLQNGKISDFESKMTNSLKEIEDQHHTYLDNLNKIEDNIEKTLSQIVNIEKQDINLSIQELNKVILENENNQNDKFDQMIIKISSIESNQKTNNNLHKKNSKKIDDVASNLPNIIMEMNDVKISNERGHKQILNSLSDKIRDFKKDVNAHTSNSLNKATENNLKKIEDLAAKVQSSEASLINSVMNTGQNIQTTINILEAKVSNIPQNSSDGKKINEIYKMFDYMKRVACSNLWITPYCNQNNF